MSIIGSNILAGAAGSGVSAYEIEQSLRFNSADNARLVRIPSTWSESFGSWDGTTYPATVSVWVKLAKLGSANHVINAERGSRRGIRFSPGLSYDQLGVVWNDGGGLSEWLETDSVFRDPSAWYHIFVVTSTSGWKIYVNGVEQPTTVDPTLSATDGFLGSIGGVDDLIIGYSPNVSALSFDGYMAEFHLLDNLAASVTDFGEFDDNGVWRPIAYTGSHGTEGFYLKFDPSATNGIGHDHSGNGNNFTATGFTTSGTGTDVMSDTPTTNWCTLNPINKNSDPTLSEGNLSITWSGTAAHYPCASTFAVGSGKWYFETTNSGTNNSWYLGIVPSPANINNDQNPGNGNAAGYGITGSSGTVYHNNSGTSYGSAFSQNDVITCAVDLDNGKIWWGKNGTWFNSGDPAAGTNAALTGISSTEIWEFIFSGYGSTQVLIPNFGQRAFAYTPPTGFKALNTSNLPAPDIADGSDYFNTVLWTGNGSYPRAVTGAGFSPDWVWMKSRTDAYGHAVYDRVRGVGTSSTSLRIDGTGAEGSSEIGPYVDMDSLDSDGFTLGNTVSSQELFNLNAKNYVAWTWKADNSSGSSNTDGSITSTVSANPTAGFSIVAYTGDGDAAATVGHGLGVAPNFVILKRRTGGTANWQVAEDGSFGTKELYLNGTDGYTDGANEFSVTSTVIDLNSSHFGSNASGSTYIAYCFAEVEGYSKFGSYTGNGSSDGPFVYCGFRPAWVLFKRTDSSENWQLYDTARNEYNVVGEYLLPNSSSAGATITVTDIVSNGFKLRVGSGNPGVNASGGTYIFAAFAENPFGGSGVSPATAR